MQHFQHIALIQNAIGDTKGTWADLGSGAGAFTLALADITNQQAEIYSIDKDKNSLQQQQEAFESKFPETQIHFIHQDFTEALQLPPLDGILMANSLHYVQQQVPFLKKIKQYLKPKGKVVIVEYNTDHGNHWVPYPFSYPTFEKMAQEAGFTRIAKTGSVPSQFLNEMYSAVATLLI